MFNPLAQIAFDFEDDLPLDYEKETIAKFDMTLVVHRSPMATEISINYDAALFDDQSVDLFLKTYTWILEKCIDGETLLRDIAYPSQLLPVEKSRPSFLRNDLKPIQNTSHCQALIVLNDFQRPVPPGFVGELFFVNSEGIQQRTGYRAQSRGTWIKVTGRTGRTVRIGERTFDLSILDMVFQSSPDINEAYSIQADGVIKCFVRLPNEISLKQIHEHLSFSLPRYMVPDEFYEVASLIFDEQDRFVIPSESDRKAEFIPSQGLMPQSPTQKKVFSIWSDVLGHDRFQAGSNFFEVGGDSLKLIKLALLVKKQFGYPITTTQLMLKNTIASLASAIDGERASGQASALIDLASEVENQLVILFYPYGGQLSCYRNLIDLIKSEYKVIGVQETVQDDGKNLSERGESIADRILEQIEVRDYEQIWLVGWSMGALIAHETAVSLERKGFHEKLNGLVLLDPWFPEEDELNPPDLKSVTFLEPEVGVSETTLVQHEKILMTYTPRGQHSIPTRLVFASNRSDIASQCHVWKKVLAGPYQHEVIPNDHYGLLLEPTIGAIAAILKNSV